MAAPASPIRHTFSRWFGVPLRGLARGIVMGLKLGIAYTVVASLIGAAHLVTSGSLTPAARAFDRFNQFLGAILIVALLTVSWAVVYGVVVGAVVGLVGGLARAVVVGPVRPQAAFWSGAAYGLGMSVLLAGAGWRLFARFDDDLWDYAALWLVVVLPTLALTSVGAGLVWRRIFVPAA